MESSGRLLPWAVAITLLAIVSCWMFVPTIHPAPDRSRAARARWDMRTAALALEAYRLEHGAYPTPALSKTGWTVLPPALTTPVAYLSTLPTDSFDKRQGTYGYALLADDPVRWRAALPESGQMPQFILITQGPRGTRGAFGLDGYSVYDPTNGTRSGGVVYMLGGPPTVEDSTRSGQNVHGRAEEEGVETKSHNADLDDRLAEEDNVPGVAPKVAFTYDPTNGTISRSEIYRVKQ
jgi:type II secretory pathway pseudopilin PulG